MGDQLTGKVIAEKYRIDTQLRNGDLGDFYRGRHLFMDKPVTLKILSLGTKADEQDRNRFLAEARNAPLFPHPNIMAVSDYGSDKDGSDYIVFEGFEGEMLKQAIIKDGQFSLEKSLLIARQIAEALSAAHEQNFTHGNLIPESVLLANISTDVNVKVCDFGTTAASPGRMRIDERSAVNVAYFAPETFSGLNKADGRSDIYSLGIILYQMLAGEVPFKGETPTDVMLKHVEEPPPPINSFRPDVPGSVETVVQKALSKDPMLRYQTAGEFAKELNHASDELANPAASRNNIWKTAFVVLAGIAVLAAALIYATSVKQTNPTTQLQPDANGQPVQPINPATGTEEQALAAMPGMMPDNMANANMAQPPGTLPGGDNYNPWASGMPPPGAPPTTYVAPGGQVYTIDPNNPSQFMPMDGGVVLVPIPANTNTAVKPSPTPKTAPANTNAAATPAPTATPPVRPALPKPTPTPRPAATQPAAANKPETSEN